jgi:hypothetical protein
MLEARNTPKWGALGPFLPALHQCGPKYHISSPQNTRFTPFNPLLDSLKLVFINQKSPIVAKGKSSNDEKIE